MENAHLYISIEQNIYYQFIIQSPNWNISEVFQRLTSTILGVIINSTREDQSILQASSQHSLSQGGALVVTLLLIVGLNLPK